MIADKNSDKTCIILILFLLKLRNWVYAGGGGGVVAPLFCKGHNFRNVTDFSLTSVYGGKKLYLLKFYSTSYEISHDDSKNT